MRGYQSNQSSVSLLAKIITKEYDVPVKISAMVCEYCGTKHEDDELILLSRCHPEAPTWAVLLPHDHLRIECADCKKEIVTLKLDLDSE